MAKDVPPSFQFYPRDFVSSRAVRMMTPEQRGGYIMLLCHAWMSDECGELPGDDQALSQLSELGDRWPACKAAIMRAFDAGSPDGRPIIIQKRMQNEREAQLRRFKQARKGASITNVTRWGKVAQRPDSDPIASRTAITPASASASAGKEESLASARDSFLPVPEDESTAPRETLGAASRSAVPPEPERVKPEVARALVASLEAQVNGRPVTPEVVDFAARKAELKAQGERLIAEEKRRAETTAEA